METRTAAAAANPLLRLLSFVSHSQYLMQVCPSHGLAGNYLPHVCMYVTAHS